MIDCHYHLDESIVSLDGLLVSMDAAGIEKTALVPSLCPPVTLPGFAPYLMPLLRLGLHQSRGPIRSIVLSIYRNQRKPDGTVDLLGKLYKLIEKPDNDAVLAAIRHAPDRFLGYTFVDPAGPVDPVSEVERCMAQPGMIGVKAHPFWYGHPISKLMDVASLCQEKQWPLLIHLGAGEKGDFRVLPEQFPRLQVIYAHGGVPYLPQVCRYAREKKNVFVDLSSSVYLSGPSMKKAVVIAGAEKCLFGTDGPYFHVKDDRFDFPFFTERLNRLALPGRDLERIAVKNFREIFG